MTTEQRFWAKVDRRGEDECWPWLGFRHFGYGRFKNPTSQQVHRYSYELQVGPIPEGMVIDHLCRNKGCVNPAHMEVVTVRENTLRGNGPSAIHAAKTHCIRGHELTDENTYVNSRGWRKCRTCHRMRQASYRAALASATPDTEDGGDA